MEYKPGIDQWLDLLDTEQVDRSKAGTLIAEYGRYIGIDNVSLDSTDSVALLVPGENGDTLVTLTYLPARAGLYASVDMPVEEAFRGDCLRIALRQNQDWQQTCAGTFGIVPGSGQLTLNAFLVFGLTGSGSLDCAGFDLQLARFVECAGRWQESFEDHIEALEERAIENRSNAFSRGHGQSYPTSLVNHV